MQRLRNHLVGVDQGEVLLFSDFSTNGAMWSETGPREVRTKVSFSEAFRHPPTVTVGISMWDVDSSSNLRTDIKADNITRAGFEIVFKTWGDSKLARMRASWLAIGELHQPGDWPVD